MLEAKVALCLGLAQDAREQAGPQQAATLARLQEELESFLGVQIPILPTRCDYYRIKITGTGMWRLYAMAREQYEGSEIH